MLDEILPERVSHSLDLLNKKGLREIRIRVKMPIIINYGSNFFLGENGIVEKSEYAHRCSYEEMQDIVFRACERSIYAYDDQLKQGFITLKNGQRVGVCGEIITENGVIKTLKNFSSINIRIPHQIPNCSLSALPFLYDENGILNTLIISPPGAGKTTFLRDLCYQISQKNFVENLLIIDERGEICNFFDGEMNFNVGYNTDVYSYATKKFGLENGIRTLCPSAVAMDELANPEDIGALDYALGAGIKIVATAHAKDINELFKKPYFKTLLGSKIFQRIVVLSKRNGAGTLEGIYDENKINFDLRA